MERSSVASADASPAMDGKGGSAGADADIRTDGDAAPDSGTDDGTDGGTDSRTGGAAATGADGGAACSSGAAQAWSALGGDPALLERVTEVRRPGLLPARLPVLELARATVTACSLAAAELRGAHASAGTEGTPGPASASAVPDVRVDDGAVATAFASERHLRVDGRAPASFAPLSRFWRTADGWLRTHANYPHHRARLLTALGVADTGDDARLAEPVGAALAGLATAEAEERVFGAGGLAVAVRPGAEWAAHPQGSVAGGRPLVATVRLDQAPPLPLPPGDGHGVLHGVRVLDLTRVIAGPVATRTLALLGADVLRIDSPRLPESEDAHADTGFGKRSALLDLANRADQATFEELLSAADVVVTGYRPGALDRFGLAPESLAARRPGLVVGQLSAWGTCGPWRRRRGFDSLVQAASGIALAEGTTDEATGERTPGALPAQALDHGTGYLLAAAVLRALTEQRHGRCGTRVVRLSLARTAAWLLDGLAPGPLPEAGPPLDGDSEPGAEPGPWLAETGSSLGRLRYARPPLSFAGGPGTWAAPPGRPGADAPVWW